MKKDKLKKIIEKSILLVMGVYFITKCESCISNQDEETYRNHPVATSSFVPQYYDSLFKPQIKDKLKLIISYEKKQKDTVSNFIYDGKYIIQIYKLSQTYNLSLMISLKESYNPNEQEVGVIYYDNEQSRMNIHDRVVIPKNDKPSKIFISLYGNNPKIIAKNDSSADFFLDFKSLSIKYNINGPQEVFAEVYKSAETIPLEMLFLKRNKKLYLLLMSPQKAIDMNPRTLYNLIDN